MVKFQVQPLLGWGEDGQTSASVMSSLAMVGRPTSDSRENDVVGGIMQGLEALSEPSSIRVKFRGAQLLVRLIL